MMQKSGDRRLTNRHLLRRQYGLELSQRDIRLLCHQLPDQVLVRRQSMPLVSAEFGRNDTARFAVEPTKADHRADTHTEALRNFRYRGALLRRPHHARTQILRIRLPHPILASFPARILNPIRVRMGIPPDSVFSGNALVLLRYKLLRARFRAVPPQHGHRGNRLTIAAMSLRRMVAIEFGMCRSGRKGGSSGSVTVGYGKLREQRGGTRS